MIKKVLNKFLAFCLTVPCAFALTACKEEVPPATPPSSEPSAETPVAPPTTPPAETPVTPPADNPATQLTFDVWDGTVGVVSDPVEGVITIDSAAEFAAFAEDVNCGNEYVGITIKLTCNIDLNNQEWTPIGFGSSNAYGIPDGNSLWFDGNFDGEGHTIKNLKITTFEGGGIESQTSASGVALFGHTFNASIENLIVDTAEVEGNHFVAAVVGFAIGTDVENVTVKNAEISCVYDNGDESGDKAGAVVAFITDSEDEEGSVKNCTVSNSTVDADRDAGQVIGCIGKIVGNDVELENNSVTNVTVSYNGDIENKHSNNSNTHINNDIIGRDARLEQ